MLVDSHCHLNQIDLSSFDDDFNQVMLQALNNDVGHFLCVCIELEDMEALSALSSKYPQISISVGVHPTSALQKEPTAEVLIALADNHSCIAIGETGLDYFHVTTEDAQATQRQRFREHIRASLHTKKPLIIHTRQAAEDTLRIMTEENARDIGGVMHCFSENWDIAQRALDLNFYISFSGILTFKNATQLQEVAKKVPLDRILIETDSPYLAPVPFRGKQNHPALVKYVAEALSTLRGIDYNTIAEKTTENFYRCFRVQTQKR